MFASPSSSSSSDRGYIDPIEAAARGTARRTRRIRPVGREAAVYTTTDPLFTDSLDEKHASSNQDLTTGRKPIVGDSSNSGVVKSRYIGKLVVSAQERKARAEELAQRRVEEQRVLHSTAFPESGRFVTKSYNAALRRRAEAEREARAKASIKGSNLRLPSAHAAAIRFAAADAAATAQHNSIKVGTYEHREDDKETTDNPCKYETVVSAASQPILSDPDQKGVVSDDKCSQDEKGKNESRFSTSTDDNPQTDKIDGQQDRKVGEVPEEKVNIDVHFGSQCIAKSMKPKKKRGLRRNDAKSIEAYRQRYLQRKSERLQIVK